MALLAFDGFDHYRDPTADMLARLSFWRWISAKSGGGYSFVTGRNSTGQALQVTDSQAIVSGVMTSGRSPVYFGMGFYAVGGYGSGFVDPIIRLMDMSGGAPVEQWRLLVNLSTASISVYSGSTLLGTSAPGSFSPGTFSYLEFGGVISTTVGSITVRVNSVTILSLPVVSNQQSSNALVSGLVFDNDGDHIVDQMLWKLDDFYVCDGSTGPGTYPCNTFLGGTTVVTLRPTSNVSVSWTPLSGTNWQEVSEAVMDGDTSYNTSSTVGSSDSFTMGSLPTGTTSVLGVQVTGAYRGAVDSTHTIQQGLVSGGTTVSGTATNITTSYAYVTDLFSVDPHTSTTWSITAVNSLYASYSLAT